MKRFPEQQIQIRGLAAALALYAGAALAETPARVQVFVTGDEGRARQMAGTLDTQGFGPAQVRPEGAVFKVLTRAYPSVAESNFARSELRGAGYPQAFTVQEPAAGAGSTGENPATGRGAAAGAEAGAGAGTVAGVSLPSVTSTGEFQRMKLGFTPEKPVSRRTRITPEQEALSNGEASEKELLAKGLGFYKRSQAPRAVETFDAFLLRFPASPQAPRARLMRAYWLLEQRDRAGAKAGFESVVTGSPQATEAGEAALRLAYMKLADQASDAECLAAFRSIAAGELAAEPEVRHEAALRLAALYHRGRDLDAADQAYAAVESAARDRNVKAFAHVQRAGLALEKAWNRKGTFEQAQTLADDLLRSYPEVTTSTRATAALMAMECSAYRKDFAGVLGRGEKFLKEFSGVPEADLGYYWVAKARLETGDPDGAAAILGAVYDADLPAKERFKDVDLRRAVRGLLVTAHERAGRPEQARSLAARED